MDCIDITDLQTSNKIHNQKNKTKQNSKEKSNWIELVLAFQNTLI